MTALHQGTTLYIPYALSDAIVVATEKLKEIPTDTSQQSSKLKSAADVFGAGTTALSILTWGEADGLRSRKIPRPGKAGVMMDNRDIELFWEELEAIYNPAGQANLRALRRLEAGRTLAMLRRMLTFDIDSQEHPMPTLREAAEAVRADMRALGVAAGLSAEVVDAACAF
uniref:Uncharacterized protein n=1 Tax=Chlamydomonas leiostraca TaxID=1034604 RepID=A0A7S0WT33_9CHLO|mmetsp:Transcript_27339/g.69571  ORF Transcript_27339/g.69571 Transcript_27339/m.69571 type:complete len:170 (+) Transcript_27339:863-1372(+)